MPRNSAAASPEKFTTFGDLLRFLRRKADLTQRELSIAVGYSESQISRLEQNERGPDEVTLAARFVPALSLEDEPQWVARLLELGAATRSHASDVDAPQPIKEAKPTPHNLPIQLTSFIGREKEISEIGRLLSSKEEGIRLLTLTGHGGCGKTRLTLQVTPIVLDQFPDGVWLIEFAPLSDPTLVPQTVAAVLRLKEDPSQPILSTLTGHLADKKALLLLDNCEHLVQATANLVESLLLACPNLHILATSREMLGVAGERAFYVPSLALPNLKTEAAVDAALQSEAVKLFVERARTVIPRFELNDKNVSAVIRVCHRLDGIPLAIELAAVRLKMMPVQQIADHIDDAFRLLTGGIRTAMPRHQTLQALMDWSYNLLTEPEKTMFRRLAVFAGGWTIEAAELVGTGQEIATGNVIDIVAHLVDKSLVLVDEQDNVARYHFLETVRQYASTKLAASGEADLIRRRHAEYFLALARNDAPVLLGAHRNPLWYDQMEMEHDNFRAVLIWCQSVSEGAEIGFHLTDALTSFWFYRGYWSEGLSWLERVLSHPQAENYPLGQAIAQMMLGVTIILRFPQGPYTVGDSYLTRSLKVFQEYNDRPNIAWCLHWLGQHARERGDAITARSRLEECVRICQELEDDSMIASATNTLAETITLQGEIGLAKAMLEENLVFAQKVGDTDTIGWALNHLGHIAQVEGEYDRAIQFHEKSLRLFQQMGPQNEGTIWAHQSLGETGLAQGNVSLAIAHFTEALASCQHLGERAGMAWCLAGLAGVAALEQEPERAAWLWGAAEALRQSFGIREAPASHTTHERLKAEVRQQLGEAMFDSKRAEGQATPIVEVIAEALS